ncbi:zinc transport system permease protein [Salsuginibacillus halophilus]|uniref:Zinc transport system permease protein n=1 Tax=Salsuginibacillus halophilus TaxID=517424 RepID=A0A2P8HFJ7_9BACI|nr:metal ABC transporter permease [Salsuginibacillus halophilus]PSL44999.1 zinc transport system permease protein [Salsuginibacillus halophilus]
MIEAFFRFDFLQYALFTGLMIGFLAPVLGVFLVVKRMSLIADALSHITLTGIAFHMLLARYNPTIAAVTPLYLGLAFSVSGALFIEWLRRMYTSFKELAIPIVLSGGIGLGVVFISLADGFTTDLFNYLFGSVVAVTIQDVRLIAIITIVVTVLLTLFYKELFYLSFDEEHAAVAGLPRQWLHLLFIVMVALVITASMRIVGILLVSALMSLPVAAAMQWAKSFKQMFVYAVLIGEVSVVTGLIFAFQLDWSAGGTIVLVAVGLLLLSMAGRRLLTKVAVQMNNRRTTSVE